MRTMKEIRIFLDKNNKKEIKDFIVFEKVIAGEKSIAEIYIQSTINYHINIELELVGEDISIFKKIENIKPMETEKVEFEIYPKLTTMKPITAKLKIKLDYILI